MSGLGGSTGTACADLSTCCSTLTDANAKMSCALVVTLGIDQACAATYDNLCGQP